MRIAPVPAAEAGWFGRLAYFLARRQFPAVPESLTATAHHSDILFGVGMMERAMGKTRLLPLRLKTLASIRTATRIGCPF